MSSYKSGRMAGIAAMVALLATSSPVAAAGSTANTEFGATSQLALLLQPAALTGQAPAVRGHPVFSWNMAAPDGMPAARIASAAPDGMRVAAAAGAPEAKAGGLATGSMATKARKVRAPKPRRPELLASVAISFGKLPALARIAPAYAEIDAGFLDNCRTELCRNASATLHSVIEGNADGQLLALISAVNRSVNRLITYRRDQDLYGVMDFWAKPSSTLNKGMGDCEDYAILKMAVLAKAGVPADSLSVVILRDETRNVYHAVTAVQTASGAYILDNLQQDIRKDSELPNYMPLYSVSAGRGYIYGKRIGGGSLVASAGRLDAIAPGEGLSTYAQAAPSPVLMWNGFGPF